VTADGLRQLAERTRVVLLDFDGPVRSIFAGYPALTIAGELRQLLVDQGVTLPSTCRTSPTRHTCPLPIRSARPKHPG
jgi:hypothetical protein